MIYYIYWSSYHNLLHCHVMVYGLVQSQRELWIIIFSTAWQVGQMGSPISAIYFWTYFLAPITRTQQ